MSGVWIGGLIETTTFNTQNKKQEEREKDVRSGGPSVPPFAIARMYYTGLQV